MFENIYSNTFDSSQTTKAICDGAEVRYSVMFVACDDGKACAFTCAAIHPGVSEPVAACVSIYGDKITSF